ncbi:MAG: hypothetical protein HGA52_06495 [Bacteroidales bacterium]|nr:hypothetical protein [Bacteroidales bacterium]
MDLKILNKIKKTRILYVDGEQCFVARGLKLLIYEKGEKKRVVAKLPAPYKERLLSLFTFTRLGLRLGIHIAIPLADDCILAVMKKKFILIKKNGECKVIDNIHRGNKPASKGVCLLPDGTVIYGEYFLNNKREAPVSIYKCQLIENGFEKIYEFLAGEIRHIHFIQWDSFDSCLWMGTGDRDEESSLYVSYDYGTSWERIGGGSQKWRAVSIIISENALYWGTDAGSDAEFTRNYIVCYNKKTKNLSIVQEVQGPCHGSGCLSDGSMIISTGVEGGVNEKDNYAHLWASTNGFKWNEVYSKEKNIWPHIIQFGVMRIPSGCETSSKLHYTGLALTGASEVWFECEIKNN